MSVIGSGRGKLILFGEHAAVYGFPAVGTALPCRTEISPGSLTSETDRGDNKILQEVLSSAAALVPGIPLQNFSRLTQLSDVPRTGGFGSSAALCVAVSRTVLGRTSKEYNREVHLLANQLEKRFHGTPSGIDTGMACDTSAAAWVKCDGEIPERKPLEIPEWHIIYGALPRTSPTADSVGRLRELKNSGDSSVISAMGELGRISELFIEAARIKKKGFPARAAALANQAQRVLASLNLSSEELDTVLELAGELGASGGKLSGGGMGGAFYICVPDRETESRILRILPGKLFRQGIRLTVSLTAFEF
ncbi:MAG: hypothetical protein DRP70_03675 [Spirochaetes bacterium]|nr:MAG: hypothetical protein DRP70_03675 [Spirochaetota bacterium]